MSDAIKVFTDLAGQVGRLPLAGLMALFILAFGLAAKRTPWFSNKYIPLMTLIVSTVGYTVLGKASAITSVEPGWRQYVVLSFYGFIEGFFVWGAHKFVIKKLEKLLPEGFFPSDEFNTKEFKNPNAGDAQPNPAQTAPTEPNKETK